MSVTGNVVNFKELEKEIQKNLFATGRNLLTEIFEQWDNEISETRDRKEYRHKGRRKTVLKTLFGEVEYSLGVLIF